MVGDSRVDVLLTHSYHLPFDPKQLRKMQPYPPLGTIYAATLLQKSGIKVAVFDTMLRDPGEFAEVVRSSQPKVVAIYEDSFNFLSKMCLTRMREIAFSMAATARCVGATVVAHGSDAADHVGEYLDAGVNGVLLGEGEWALLDVVRAILRGRSDWTAIEGVVTSASASAAAHRRPASVNIDALDAPSREFLDVEPYRKAWIGAHGSFSMNLVSSRGCPFRCNWCAKPIFENSYRVRRPDRVAEEMLELKRHYRADHLWFADDIFGLDHRWVADFAAQVQRRDAALPFKVQARADLISDEIAGNLKRAGCAEIWMGVESGSQKVLDAMDKGLRVEEVRAARRILREHGIRACFFLQFGYPGEEWADICRTVELIRETKPDDIGVSVSYPLPNTRFYERVREQMGRKRNWRDSEDLSVMFKAAYTDEFYRALRNAIHAEVEALHARSSLLEIQARALWVEVESMEPRSRVADATVIESSQEVFALPRPQGFIPLHHLTTEQES